MIEQIGTAPMEVALLGAFTFILGAFALILWDLLRGRRHGWLRVTAVVVGATACALAATVISAGVGWAVAVTLEPDEPSPAHNEQTTPENQQRTSPAEGRSPETTTERSASPTATATASPTVTASPTPSASPTATGSPSP
jgi:septal ring-binding cell division protein DamX